MRAVVERCQHRGPRMHTLVTLGGQHQGVMNVPLCDNPSFNNTPTSHRGSKRCAYASGQAAPPCSVTRASQVFCAV